MLLHLKKGDGDLLIVTEPALVKSSFIVILLHVWTYSGMKCRVSQDHGAT